MANAKGGDRVQVHYTGTLHDTGQVRIRVIRALDLKSHGLEIFRKRPSVLALDLEGRGMLLGNKDRHTAKEINFYSPEDAGQYLKYRQFIKQVAGMVNRIFDEPPPAIESFDAQTLWGLFRTGFALRRLGKKNMSELLRIAPMCIADWLNEWFETNCLKAASALTYSD